MPAGEMVDVVDNRDIAIGTASVSDCLEKGLLHRAVAILVVRNSGRFLLQQRSRRDLWHPGLWTLSSTGHVGAGETYDEGAARELREELGISAELHRLWRRLLPPIKSRGLTEREWVTLYVARTDMPCTIDRAEVESVREVTAHELRLMFDDGSMTPDAVTLLAEYLERQ